MENKIEILSKILFKHIIEFGSFLADNILAIFVLSITNFIISYFVDSYWKYLLMGINAVIISCMLIRR